MVLGIFVVCAGFDACPKEPLVYIFDYNILVQ